MAARIGIDDLAAHQIAFEIWNLLALTLDSVAIAAQAMIGMTLGSGDAARARSLGRRMIQWGFWCGVGLGCIVGLLSPLLPYLFSADAAVLSLTAFLLIHVALQQPLAGVVFALDGILIGAGNLRFLAVTMWISAVVLVGGGLVVLTTGAGIGCFGFASWHGSCPVPSCSWPAFAPPNGKLRERAASPQISEPGAEQPLCHQLDHAWLS